MKYINIKLNHFLFYLQDYVTTFNNLFVLIKNKLLLILNQFMILLDQILSYLDYYTGIGIEIISIGAVGGIILLSGRAVKEILDTTAKVVAIGAGSTIIYNNWFKNSDSGGSSSDNNDNKKSNKEKNNKNNTTNENSSSKNSK